MTQNDTGMRIYTVVEVMRGVAAGAYNFRRFEDAPYLRNIFGLIRIQNIRDVLSWYLNIGKDSPLTKSRDGFDPRHEFTKMLFNELSKQLEPIYRREEDRFNKSISENLSKETRQRLNEAIRELNKFLKELIGEGEGVQPETLPSRIDPSKPLQFVPSVTRLTIGKSRIMRLYFKKGFAKPTGTIIYDSSNPKIEIKPLSQQIPEGKEEGDYLVYEVSLRCDTLHENAKITALAEGLKEMFEAHLEILDVTSPTNILPPDEMEFRPRESRGQPNRNNNLTLYVNPKTIPLGRKIKLEIQKAHGAIGLLEDGKRAEAVSVTFEKSHLIPGTSVGRILIPWRGTGWGQSARVTANTKKPDGSLVYAEGLIILEQPEETGGIIKDVKYRNLMNEKSSDLVDGIIYINSNHFLNKVVFGADQESYNKKIENDVTAQYRLSTLVVEQSVFRFAEESVRENKLVLQSGAPVTSLREFIDQKTHQFSPKIVKALMTK